LQARGGHYKRDIRISAIKILRNSIQPSLRDEYSNRSMLSMHSLCPWLRINRHGENFLLITQAGLPSLLQTSKMEIFYPGTAKL
jgi:hypothetical protein